MAVLGQKIAFQGYGAISVRVLVIFLAADAAPRRIFRRTAQH